MKTLKKITYTLLGLLLIGTVALIGVILFAEYSGKRFQPGHEDAKSEIEFEDEESRLVYDENGNLAELPGIVMPQDPSEETAADSLEVPAADSAADTADSDDAQSSTVPEQEAAPENALEQTYIMNKESSIFHLETCPDVANISEDNHLTMTSTRDMVAGRGYSPCQNCNP